MGTKKMKTGQIVLGQSYRITAVDDWGHITYRLLAIDSVMDVVLDDGHLSMSGESLNKRHLTVCWPDDSCTNGHCVTCETETTTVHDMGNSYGVTNYVPMIDVDHNGMTLRIPLDGLTVIFESKNEGKTSKTKKPKKTKATKKSRPVTNMPGY